MGAGAPAASASADSRSLLAVAHMGSDRAHASTCGSRQAGGDGRGGAEGGQRQHPLGGPASHSGQAHSGQARAGSGGTAAGGEGLVLAVLLGMFDDTGRREEEALGGCQPPCAAQRWGAHVLAHTCVMSECVCVCAWASASQRVHVYCTRVCCESVCMCMGRYLTARACLSPQSPCN